MNKQLLYRFFEGYCTPEEVGAIRKWMETSPENKDEFYYEAKLFDAIGLLQPEEARVNIRSPKPRSVTIKLMKVAVVLIILLTAGWSYVHYFKHHSQQSMIVVDVPAGEKTNIILSDGTKIWLNACTRMQYSEIFGKDMREIILDGEAYFEVAKDPKHPFIVRTRQYDVEALGTSFNINAYDCESEFTTSLIEGSVKIMSSGDAEQQLTLEAGQMVSNKNGLLESESIKNFDVYRWRDGLICFDNIPFIEVMKTFEKCYAFEIQMENKRVEKYFCTGKFRQTDGIVHALKVLQKDANFTFEKKANANIILIK